jgi:xylulokinase
VSEPVFVACDMGTTLVKAAVVDLEGAVLGQWAEESRLERPRPGVVEQDLLQIEAEAHTAIRRAVDRSGRAADIAAVSFSSQMSGIGAVGEGFEPVAPFDSWLDSRCAQDIYDMEPHARRVAEVSGCPPTYSHGPKERWLKRTRPDVYRRTRAFQVPGPFVAARLAGLDVTEAFIDKTNLCFTNLSDTHAGAWSDELVDLFGLDPEKLPRIVAADEVIGTVSRASSAATGIPAGVPVVAGGGDQIVACLGVGVSRPGRASDSAGTASLFSVCLDRWAPDTDSLNLITAQSIVPGQYLAFAFVNGGGQGLEWVRKEVLGTDDSADVAFATLERLAAAVRPGSEGLLWLPHFQGGVTPPRPHLRSGWIGLTGGHTRGHLYRSVLEGIALQYASWAEHAATAMGRPLTEVRAMGGGSKSDLWLSIKADVLGIPFVRTSTSEAALLGNALLGAAATGHVDDLAGTADRWNSTSPAVRPDAERHRYYERHREVFERLGRTVDPVFRELSDLSSDTGQTSDLDAAPAAPTDPTTAT